MCWEAAATTDEQFQNSDAKTAHAGFNPKPAVPYPLQCGGRYPFGSFTVEQLPTVWNRHHQQTNGRQEMTNTPCPDCDSVLQRRHDDESGTVVLDCANCGYSEPAERVRMNYKSPVKGRTDDE